jgi:hypothetical protein
MNNKINNEFVANFARNAGNVFDNALNWANDSKDPIISSNLKLKKDLRKSIYQAKKLEFAALSKMCVGVYGASQAGKSYLVSVLARKGAERLYAIMGKKDVDFIETINPEGGKESTGLVTRFTTDKVSTPENYPIQARLLSEIDIIKTLANSYVYDVSVGDDEQISDHVDIIEKLLKEVESYPTAQSFINIEDVYELEDYCNSRFTQNLRFIALKQSDFWNRVTEILPNTNDQGRKKIFELLWEGLESYSQIYDSLLNELNKLEHSKVIFCGPESLFDVKGEIWDRSNDSIINVSTLEKLGNNDISFVNVVNLNGKQTQISRSNLTALVAEIVVQVKEQPHDFFLHTDLLDFPGARSRKVQPKDNKILGTQSIKVENFLRGKVAYLFDRYSTDLELSSMLLCVGPSNLEVVGLEKLIENWIGLTHGEKPEDREKKQTSLFLILTKFDMEFSQGAGKSADDTRWTTRIEASLLKPFGAHSHKTNWVNKWHTNRPFNNTFWLRNPNADQAGLIDSEGAPGSSKELNISQGKREFVSQLRDGFLNNAYVNQHFSNPSEAWNAGMSLNDGGITLLVNSLSKICKPEIKLQQVFQYLEQIIKDRDTDLRRYYVSGDLDLIRKEKQVLAMHLVKTGGLLLQKKRLGDFIPLLLVDDANVYDVFIKSEKQVEKLKNTDLKSITPEVVDQTMDPALAELLGLTESIPVSTSQNAKEGLEENLPHYFISNLFSYWSESVQEKLNSSQYSDYLNIDRETLVKLLRELEIAARRTGLIEDIISLVIYKSQYRSGNKRTWIWKQVAPITSIFNQFIVAGGNYSKLDEMFSIVRLDGSTQKIFEPLSEIEGTLDLPDISKDFSMLYFSDWLNGLQFSVKSNADFISGVCGDIEGNLKLGKILINFDEINSTFLHQT